MNEREAKDMLQAKLTCLELDSDIEGCDGDCRECEYNYTQGTFGEYKEVCKMAIQALEKQIAKKVIENRWIYTKCNCGHDFSVHHGDGYYSIPYNEKTNYCPDCGQKLDWTVEE